MPGTTEVLVKYFSPLGKQPRQRKMKTKHLDQCGKFIFTPKEKIRINDILPSFFLKQ